MLLCVKTPTTYLADGPFLINDKHGDLFYARIQPGYFNLPVGDYELTEGSLVPSADWNPFPQIEQVDPGIAPGMKLEMGINPNKATYFANENKAIIDNFIIEQPFKPARIFCVIHEKGHAKFRPPTGTMAKIKNPFSPGYDAAYKEYLKAECNCDIYAYNVMVRNGYNPSQVRYAIRLIFKPDNERLEILDKQILEVNNYKIV